MKRTKRILFLLLAVLLAMWPMVAISIPAYATPAPVSGAGVFVTNGMNNDVGGIGFRTSGLSAGNAMVYRYGTNAQLQYLYMVGGIYMVLPPSTESGYLVITGYYPVVAMSDYAPGSEGTWVSAQQYALSPAFYYVGAEWPIGVVGTQIGVNSVTNLDRWATSFTGVVYVPAHLQAVSLFLYTYTKPTNVSGNRPLVGALATNSGVVSFIPDSAADSSVLGVLQQIEQTNTNIQNIITSTSVQDQQAQEFQQNIFDLQAQVDSMNTELQQLVARPPVAQVMPTPPVDIFNPNDPAVQPALQLMTSILSSPMILPILTVVITLATVRFVLFGKRE